MEHYCIVVDDGNNLNPIDFDLLVQNLEDLIRGKDAPTPVFDFQEKRRIGSKVIKNTSAGVVIVDGTYALHARLGSLLDIRVAVVGGVHFSLLSKVKYDIGESCSLDYLIDSIFPLSQIFIMHRIVDKNYIIRPKAEFEVGRMTLGGLLALGYTVVVSYKRSSTSVSDGNLSMSLESIDTLGVPRINTPPPLSCRSVTTNEGGLIAAPKPLHVPPNLVNPLDMLQPWTRSPTKSKMEPVLATWQFISSDHPDPSSRDSLQLAPMPDSYDLDRGLLLSVQAIQGPLILTLASSFCTCKQYLTTLFLFRALLENKGHPVIVGIGGPSGSARAEPQQRLWWASA
ncbi:hypothetical protein POM88_054826 [Heracleum sosnowskyi]|uniref:Phosphoribulokinase/uridine kinase domain-containing protein n=1 Tax=Heracleum sosnowskyi TaxID=360622 RepID=A0AAD8GMT9_9APIA|nr:hypothetical protein POM88_054826 [Heracleum sosnowskyi]